MARPAAPHIVERSGASYMDEVWTHPGDALVVVIGRGHSGTRAISRQLRESGAFMGLQRNSSEDCPRPFRPLYLAARIAGRMSIHTGGASWDFSRLWEEDIPQEARKLLWEFLESLWVRPSRVYAWKLPETCLVYPWIVRLLPEARFLHWLRDPRDLIRKRHGTDNLTEWGISQDIPFRLGTYLPRAYSWIYQELIVSQAPITPQHFLQVKMEDWVLNHGPTCARLSDFTLLRMKPQRTLQGRVGLQARSPLSGGDAGQAVNLLAPHLRRLGYIKD